MKHFEMFAGYGTASFALKELGIKSELIGFSEIDKYAIQCFQQNHNSKNYGDATKINPSELQDFDLLTGGFPCQAFSVAGKMKGELDTRGTLFHEIIRIAEVKKPKYMLLENVKGLTTKKFTQTFVKIVNELHRIGYFVKIKILNSKNFGVPQNRERVWFVCFRDKEEWERFEFPKEQELKIFLKDILEEEVDEKYYLKEEQVNRLIEKGFKDKNISNSIRAGGKGSLDGKHTWDCVSVGNVNPSGKGMNGNVYTGEISPTITTNKGEGPKILDLYNKKIKDDGISICLTEPHHNNLRIAVPVLTPDRLNKRQNGRRFKTEGEPMFTLTSQDRHGILQLDVSQISREGKPRIYENVSRTLNTAQGRGHTPLIIENKDFTIRKLTPKECFRLQGFYKDQINLGGLSDTQKYKLAGNGQTLQVVMEIFKQMFK